MSKAEKTLHLELLNQLSFTGQTLFACPKLHILSTCMCTEPQFQSFWTSIQLKDRLNLNLNKMNFFGVQNLFCYKMCIFCLNTCNKYLVFSW